MDTFYWNPMSVLPSDPSLALRADRNITNPFEQSPRLPQVGASIPQAGALPAPAQSPIPPAVRDGNYFTNPNAKVELPPSNTITPQAIPNVTVAPPTPIPPLKDPANTASAMNAVNALASGAGAIGSAINTQDLASSYNDSLRAEESRALALLRGVPDILESAPTLADYQLRARNEQERRAGEGIKTGASMAGVGATIGGAIAAGAAGGSAATPIGTIIVAVVGLLAGVGMAIGGGVKRRRLAREENEASRKEVQSKFESDLRAWNSKRDNYVVGLQNTYSQERGKKQQAEDANQLARDLSGTTAQINSNKGLIDVGANPLTRLSQMPAHKMDSASPILITGSRG